MMTQLYSRVDTVEWTNTIVSIFKFDVVENGKTTKLNLLDNFGMIKLEDVIKHTITYCNTKTREENNNYLLYKALINSVT